MYRPLSECLTIKESGIEGLGLFTTIDLPQRMTLGRSHIKVGNEIVRTPLGGFYNHSDTPNCYKLESSEEYWLVTLRKIKAGEEITVKYTLYEVK